MNRAASRLRRRNTATFASLVSDHDETLWADHPWIDQFDRHWEADGEGRVMMWFWLRDRLAPTADAAAIWEQVLDRGRDAQGAHVTFSGGHDAETRSPPAPGFFGAHPETQGVAMLDGDGWWMRRLWLPSAVREEGVDV
jgi:hypothetical protein